MKNKNKIKKLSPLTDTSMSKGHVDAKFALHTKKTHTVYDQRREEKRIISG